MKKYFVTSLLRPARLIYLAGGAPAESAKPEVVPPTEQDPEARYEDRLQALRDAKTPEDLAARLENALDALEGRYTEDQAARLDGGRQEVSGLLQTMGVDVNGPEGAGILELYDVAFVSMGPELEAANTEQAADILAAMKEDATKSVDTKFDASKKEMRAYRDRMKGELAGAQGKERELTSKASSDAGREGAAQAKLDTLAKRFGLQGDMDAVAAMQPAERAKAVEAKVRSNPSIDLKTEDEVTAIIVRNTGDVERAVSTYTEAKAQHAQTKQALEGAKRDVGLWKGRVESAIDNILTNEEQRAAAKAEIDKGTYIPEGQTVALTELAQQQADAEMCPAEEDIFAHYTEVCQKETASLLRQVAYDQLEDQQTGAQEQLDLQIAQIGTKKEALAKVTQEARDAKTAFAEKYSVPVKDVDAALSKGDDVKAQAAILDFIQKNPVEFSAALELDTEEELAASILRSYKGKVDIVAKAADAEKTDPALVAMKQNRDGWKAYIARIETVQQSIPKTA